MHKNFLFAFIFIFSLFVLNIETKCERKNNIPVKRFKIDLDKPARERFKEAISYFNSSIWSWFLIEKKTINPVEYLILEQVGSKLDDLFPYPFNEEIKGIADVLGCSVGDVVIFNLIYEITAYCTSIVVQNKNGQIMHGRNLDYDLSEKLQNLTFIGEYYRNGSLLFTSAQTAGYIGIVTGHKYKKFTFSINERDQGEWWINFLFALLDKKATPLTFLTREVMENATSFNEAVKMLQTQDLIAPAYFIVGGVDPDQGVVITRSQNEIVDTWNLNKKSQGIESWYLLETNYDHWLPPPPDDDRRTPGMKAMNVTTQANINYETFMDVLSITPVCNKDTVYSVVMSALVEADDDGFRIIIH